VGALSIGLGLALHHGVCPLLERAFGPFTKAKTMPSPDDDEDTQQYRLREIDDILSANVDKAPVRAEHAIHSEAITALQRCAAEAAKERLTGLAKHYRDLAVHADKLGAISLRLTAARAS
jgi:hypothetical protein